MIKILDKLASQIVRNKGKCERCGRDSNLGTAHIHPRTKFNVRWDLENLICFCWNCHLNWWHKYPDEAVEWSKAKLGEKKYNDLRIRAHLSAKGQDLAMIKIYLEKELECEQ